MSPRSERQRVHLSLAVVYGLNVIARSPFTRNDGGASAGVAMAAGSATKKITERKCCVTTVLDEGKALYPVEGDVLD